MLQKGPFSKLMVQILVLGLFPTAAYAAHDLACYEIIEPGGDYVQADSAIAPKLGIANLGDEAEFNFAVHFIAINKEEEDTVFADTVIVNYIGPYPDSIEVESDEWVPEGYCDDNEPFVYYDLLGIVNLEADEDRTNDTLSDSVTCLLSHDVGVTDICWPEEPDTPPDYYNPGSTITINATVENFGYNQERDIPVRCEVWYEDADTLVYQNVQVISALYWRGNPDDDPYIVDVTFPVWTTSSESMFCVECRTEMPGDLCPDDDFEVSCINTGVGETSAGLPFALEAITPNPFVSSTSISYVVPYTSWVKLDVFDIDGRWVKSIANDIYEPGSYHTHWDACDAAGRKVATGVYLIRMEADEFNDVRKVVIIN